MTITPQTASALVGAMRCLVLSTALLGGPAVASDVWMTGIDLHSLGRLVFGELVRSSYEIPDEVGDLKRVSVRWQAVEDMDVVGRYRQLLHSQGYTVEKRQGIYSIVKRQTVSEVFTVHNRSLTDVLDMMSGYPEVSVRSSSLPGATAEKSGDLIKAGDSRSLESVVLTGYADKVAAWKKAASALDVIPESVEVRAAVFEVSLSRGDASAVDLAGSLVKGVHDWSIGGDTSKGAFTLGIGGLTLTVSKLLTDQRFKLLSQPRVSVVSGNAARLTVGQKLPILSETTTTDGGRQTQSVKYVDGGVVLSVTPKKLGRLWEVDVSQELSSVTASGVAGNPVFNNRAVSSKLRTMTGAVNVLAGLDTAQTIDDRSRSGFLGLFGSRDDSAARTQILILLELAEPLEGGLEKLRVEQAWRDLEADTAGGS